MDIPRIPPSPAWRRRLHRQDTHELAILVQDGVELPVFLEWDTIRLMGWSALLRPTIQDGLLTPEDRSSSETVLMLSMTKTRKVEIQADGPRAMADRTLRARLVSEVRLRFSLARRIAAACPDISAFTLQALAKGALETRQNQVLRDTNVPPALDR